MPCGRRHRARYLRPSQKPDPVENPRWILISANAESRSNVAPVGIINGYPTDRKFAPGTSPPPPPAKDRSSSVSCLSDSRRFVLHASTALTRASLPRHRTLYEIIIRARVFQPTIGPYESAIAVNILTGTQFVRRPSAQTLKPSSPCSMTSRSTRSIFGFQRFEQSPCLWLRRSPANLFFGKNPSAAGYRSSSTTRCCGIEASPILPTRCSADVQHRQKYFQASYNCTPAISRTHPGNSAIYVPMPSNQETSDAIPTTKIWREGFPCQL